MSMGRDSFPRPRLAVALVVIQAVAAQPEPPYVVLAGIAADDPYRAAATLLAEHRRTEHLLSFDPARPDDVLPSLRAIGPAHVAIVLRPEQIDVVTVRSILRMATRVDDDPFVDFAHGYVTGRSPEAARRFVQNIVKAAGLERPRRVGLARVLVGKTPCAAREGTLAFGKLRYPQQVLDFVAPDGKHGRDQEWIDGNLDRLEGAGAIMMGGHGMPWEIGTGPRAEDVAKLELFPAVAFNYACHTGVTTRYADFALEDGSYVHRLRPLADRPSFALAMIDAGVTGYVAYVNPRPAGPELDIDFQHVLAGASLGESRRVDYAKIVLGYLGFGERGLAVPEFVDGARTDPKELDVVRNMMLDAATGGILYGDPAARPFPAVEAASLPAQTEAERLADGLRIRLHVDAHWRFVWCADPFRGSKQKPRHMAMKVYDRVELPDGLEPMGVRVTAAHCGETKLQTFEPLWAIEHDQGRRFLHVKVNFERDEKAAGDVVVEVVVE